MKQGEREKKDAKTTSGRRATNRREEGREGRIVIVIGKTRGDEGEKVTTKYMGQNENSAK